MHASPLCLLSATRLAKMIRAREVTTEDVLEAHLARVERANPALNAIVATRAAAARSEAREAQALLERVGPDAVPPLLGVPCTIKEAIALTGAPFSSGLVARRRNVAAADASTVARLRAAGAIPIGSTNTSELCMWMESANRVYGRTGNPYAVGRTAGGSSGGEGASVGAGMAPFGLGSDVGGSIRMPAFFCGVFGHKPSSGLVPNTGQHPLAHGEALRYLGVGPLARRAEDLWPLVALLAGPDGVDPGCRAQPLGDPDRVDVAGLRVVVVRNDGRTGVDAELVAAEERAAAHLATRGARITRVAIPGLRDAFRLWSSAMAAAANASETTFKAMLFEGRPGVHATSGLTTAVEALRLAFGRSPHTLPALALSALESVVASPAAIRTAQGDLAALRAEVEALLGDDGVLVYPPYTRPAPRHRAPLLRPFDWTYTGIWNVLEVPVTQVPLGLGRRGLPLGVQVVAAHGGDHLTIAVALELERAFGGWVPPSA